MDQEAEPTPEEQPTRRGFLGFLTVVLGAVPIVGGLYFTMRAGLSPTKDNRPKRFRLCKLGEAPAKGSTDIKEVVVSFQSRQGPRVESQAKVVFLTRDEKTDELIALAGECTHLACPVQKKELKLKVGGKSPLTCPCHGGMFSRTGAVLEGPPQKPLARLTLDTLPTDADADIYLLEV